MSKLTIHKTLNGESWVNVYHLLGAFDAPATTTEAQTVLTFERAIHLTNVLFTHYNLSDNIEDTDAYYSVPINLFGQLASGTDVAPLFNTVRIDFSKLGGGRPGRKYFRGCLNESLIETFGKLATAGVSVFQAAAQNMIDQSTAGGEQFSYVTATVHPFVQMRQLRRGSKKKNIPSSPIPV